MGRKNRLAKRLAGGQAENGPPAKKQKTQVETEPERPELVRKSNEAPQKKGRWKNKQRVMTCASRGIGPTARHLLNDLRSLMPHTKTESKVEIKSDINILNEICEVRNCNKCLYFECRKKKDLYLWMSDIKNGPSVKFLVLNYYTMGTFRMSGNCLRASRPLLTFDDSFDTPHYKIMRELLTQIFSTPLNHPKSQPFFDHVFVFSVKDDKIWFRNYQIIEEDGQLAEIGPRFVLQPVKIFQDSFQGETLWSNPHYKTPNAIRRLNKDATSLKKKAKNNKKAPVKFVTRNGDMTEDIFQMDPEQLENEIEETS